MNLNVCAPEMHMRGEGGTVSGKKQPFKPRSFTHVYMRKSDGKGGGEVVTKEIPCHVVFKNFKILPPLFHPDIWLWVHSVPVYPSTLHGFTGLKGVGDDKSLLPISTIKTHTHSHSLSLFPFQSCV